MQHSSNNSADRYGSFLRDSNNKNYESSKRFTARKVTAFGVFMVRFQPGSGKMRTRKTLNTDTFHAVVRIINGILKC